MIGTVAVVTNIPRPYRRALFGVLAQRLSTEGLGLRVFYTSDPSKHARRGSPGVEVEDPAVEAFVGNVSLRIGYDRVAAMPTGLWGALAELRPVCVVSAGFGPSSAVSAYWCRAANVPLIIWSGAWPGREGRIGAVRTASRRRLVRSADAFLAYGTAAADYLVESGARPERVFRAWNTVDLEAIAAAARGAEPRRAELGDTYGLAHANLLYVGTLVESKGVRELQSAAFAVEAGGSGWALHFVGAGPERERLEKVAREAGREDVFRFHGLRPPGDVAELLGLADGLILPTRREAWGLVINEAMACGVPVVASPWAGATRDLIVDGVSGYVVDPLDTGALAGIMSRLIAGDASCREVGRAGAEAVRAKASLGASAEAFVAAVQRALRGRAGERREGASAQPGPAYAGAGVARVGAVAPAVAAPADTGTSDASVRGARALPTVLIIGPVPPPAFGVATATRLMVASPFLATRMRIVHLDTSDRRRLSTMGKLDRGNVILGIRHLARLLRLLASEKPDVMMLTVSQGRYALLRDGLFVAAGRAFGARIVAYLRGSGYADTRVREGWVAARVLRLIVGSAARVLVLGESLVRMAHAVHPHLRVAVVPNGCPPAVAADRVGVRDESGPVLLYVGRLSRKKGLGDALRAAQAVAAGVPTLEFVVCGEWDSPEYEAEVTRYVRDSGLADVVRFHGAVAGDEKAALFTRAWALVVPSHSEGQPWVILEAMSAGVPVVATDTGAIAETVGHGASGFVIPVGDGPAMAERVLELVRDDDLWRRMADESVRRYRERFTLERSHAALAAEVLRVAHGI